MLRILLMMLCGVLTVATPAAHAQTTIPNLDFSDYSETAVTDVVSFNNHADYPVVLMSNLADKISTWRAQNPTKRLVSMNIIYMNDYRGNIVIRGMLIHYERLPKG